MANGGYKGNIEGDPIVTARVTQLADDEVCRRVGGDGKEYPETAATVTVKDIY